MPTCTARYRCRLMGGNRSDGEAVVRFLEEREPDEWGDPGRLLSRRVAAVEGPAAPSWMERLTHAPGQWRLALGDQLGTVQWGSDFSDS